MKFRLNNILHFHIYHLGFFSMEVWQINSWHYHIVPHMWYALTTKKIAFLIHMSIFSWIHPLTWNNTSIWGVNYMSFLTTWIFFQYNHSFQLWTNMIRCSSIFSCKCWICSPTFLPYFSRALILLFSTIFWLFKNTIFLPFHLERGSDTNYYG